MKLIKLYSDTCGPCKVLENNLKKSKIEYDSVNITSKEGEELIEKYDIKAIPTLLLIDDNGLVSKCTGILTVEGIKAFVNENN